MSFPDPLTQPPATSSARLPGLDMLRGIAALYVLGFHLEWNFGLQPRLFSRGYLAVDLFFMLSGYVMARTYDHRLAAGLSPVKFLLARYWRLWPVMAVGSLIGVPKLLAESEDITSFAIAVGFNLLLLPVPASYLAFPLNIPAWSIYFELTANLVHGLILWRLGLRWLAALIAVTTPLMVWIGIAYTTLDLGAHTDHYLAGLVRTMLSYLIGISLWRWWRDEPKLPSPSLLALAAGFFVFLPTGLLGIADWQLDLAIILIAGPLLLAGGLCYRPVKRRPVAVAAALGALSFPLYATHMPVLEGIKALGYGWIVAGLGMFLSGLALTLAVETIGRRHKARGTAAA